MRYEDNWYKDYLTISQFDEIQKAALKCAKGQEDLADARVHQVIRSVMAEINHDVYERVMEMFRVTKWLTK